MKTSVRANEIYMSMFAFELDDVALRIADSCDTVDELYEFEDELSIGAFDAIEAAIENR